MGLSRIGMTIGTLLAATCVAHAEPLVKMEAGKPKPAVVTAWSSSGGNVELTVREGTDPKTVVDAIQNGVEKVKAKVKAGKVVVMGKGEEELLKALSSIDLGGGGEDLGALAAAASGEEESGSGSSLRAKKTADLAKLFQDRATSAFGKVVGVTKETFPAATVTVQILQGPSGALAAQVKKGAKLRFRAALKAGAKGPDWSDEPTQVNAGAWFLRDGDKVRIKIGKATGDVIEAVAIDRD